MIRIEDISYSYPRGREVFSNLNMELENGRIYGLLGMNGAGKSTLLYLISSLLTPTSGKVYVNNKDMSLRNGSTLGDVFIVPEEYDLPNISLDDYVKTNKVFYPHFDENAMHKYIQMFHLPDSINLSQLSMGQKKKVYMCFALSTGTHLILMDEPTNGMDIPSKTQFRKILRECISSNSIILISTHQVKDVEALLDSVIILDNSNILLNKSIDDIKRDQGLTGDENVNLEDLFNNTIEQKEDNNE